MELRKVTIPGMTETSVQVSIEMVGLCHTDIHMRDNDWQTSDYPLVAGHEGVGQVTVVGKSVRTVSQGDYVGIGWIRDSCRTCALCRQGHDNVCKQGYTGLFLGSSSGAWGSKGTNEHGGCFIRVQRIEERFVIKLPRGIPKHVSATLLCAGATVYEPLVKYGFVGARVGIMGIGGLGHWALKLAKLRGCTSIAISSSEKKRKAAELSGADEFIIATNPPEHFNKVDLLIDTRPVNGSVNDALQLLAYNGTYCRVGIPGYADQSAETLWIPLIFGQQAIAGTAVTGSRNINDMMALCENNVEWVMKGEDVFNAEIVPMTEINEAMDRLLNRQNKGYRYVLKW